MNTIDIMKGRLDGNTPLQNLGLIILAGLLIFFAFKYVINNNPQIIKDFGLKREEVMSKYVYDVVGFTPDMLGRKDASLSKCNQYNEYIAFFDEDTRKMTNVDLERAIFLHASCHYDVTSQQYSLDNDLSSAISELVGNSAKIKDPELAILTGKISDTWRKIQLLQNEKTDLAKQTVDNEELYWKAQLGYNLNNDSFSQRQETFQRLNAETEKANNRSGEISSEVKKLKISETDLWNIFKAKTGYKEVAADKK